MNKKELIEKARAYALKNAVSYKGEVQKGSVISGLFNEGLKKNEVKKYIKDIGRIISEVNKLGLEEQKKEYENLGGKVSKRIVRVGLPELPNVKKREKVVMRFAPSASGPLHVGHALTASISYLFVKKYGGKFYVRIEDTNPENVYKNAYKMISDESKWLFENKIIIQVQSDRLEKYYKFAEKLIKKNLAYVCTCSQEAFKNHVGGKTSCPCRTLKIKDSLFRWKNMLNKSKDGFKPGGAVLRFKTLEKLGGMKHPNPAMRDFPLARINLEKHPRQGNKYKVWPLMNLAVTNDDIEEGMTHVIRAKDHRDNAKRQEMIYVGLKLKDKIPWTSFLGRFKFKDLELSTTKFKEGIESGKFSGWDDPKLPTISSLKKQGYKPKAFWKFAERIGLSENDKVIDKKEFSTLLKGFNK